MLEKECDSVKKIIPSVCAVLLVTAMAAVSELSGEKEVLFPEIAAIAAGAFAAPKFAWNTSPARMFGLLAAGAVSGVLIVLTPLPFPVQMCLAFLLASVMLAYSRTTFAPMISAIVLPVMLQTTSIVYPVSAVVLSAAVIGLRRLLEHFGCIGKAAYIPAPLPDRAAIADTALRWLTGSCMIIFALVIGHKLLLAPPLLVAFTEFWKPESGAQRHPCKVSLLIVLCAATGAVMRLTAIRLGCYQFIAVAVTITLVLLLMRKSGIYVPPAAALSVLAFLIPEQSVLSYPLLIAAGTLLIVGVSVLHGKLLRIRAIQANKAA